jgi:phosphatidylglycerol:prolipoprotein diacylglycerol transferase
MTEYEVWLIGSGALALLLGITLLRRGGATWAGSSAIAVLSLAAAAIGAKALSWALHPNHTPSGPAGFALDGGIFVGAIASWAASTLVGFPPLRALDALACAGALGLAAARAGCLRAGCCFGIPTEMPWAASCQYGGDAHLLQLARGQVGPLDAPLGLHPTQAYELAAALAVLFLGLWTAWRFRKPGLAAFWVGTSLGSFRLVNSNFREPDATASIPPLWVSGVVAIAAFGGLLAVWWLGGKRPNRRT